MFKNLIGNDYYLSDDDENDLLDIEYYEFRLSNNADVDIDIENEMSNMYQSFSTIQTCAEGDQSCTKFKNLSAFNSYEAIEDVNRDKTQTQSSIDEEIDDNKTDINPNKLSAASLRKRNRRDFVMTPTSSSSSPLPSVVSLSRSGSDAPIALLRSISTSSNSYLSNYHTSTTNNNNLNNDLSDLSQYRGRWSPNDMQMDTIISPNPLEMSTFDHSDDTHRTTTQPSHSNYSINNNNHPKSSLNSRPVLCPLSINGMMNGLNRNDILIKGTNTHRKSKRHALMHPEEIREHSLAIQYL
eukprot:CAMPEP_0170083022 /NCGR_PEP_ID=MMETSP0019_2-20121128/18443_1 /TAXON_ID=98059 /ORGANISM="Dinobryon sp., Strain UTEXLB2267" /LENGTH=296 /DNA_ID=CAMNT_0010298143 /DNA_START=123 /DNA_END=1014 /DNA_ORIENTATION=-